MGTDEVAAFIDESYSDIGLQVQGRSKTRLRVAVPKSVENVVDIIMDLHANFGAECALEQELDGLELHVFPKQSKRGATSGMTLRFVGFVLVLLLLIACFWHFVLSV